MLIPFLEWVALVLLSGYGLLSLLVSAINAFQRRAAAKKAKVETELNFRREMRGAVTDLKLRLDEGLADLATAERALRALERRVGE